FVAVEQTSFPHVQRLDRAGLLDLVRSRSYWAVATTEEQALVLERVGKLFDEVSIDGTIDLPYVTECYRATPLPRGWAVVDGALERELRFADFAAALAYVNRVGEAAEEANHHPDVTIRWNRVTLRWRTHSAGAITTRDVELALLGDGLGGERPPT
ncbi:MAG: 4a-hydroxytetrahydrobiopterin dehydratase, partial [Gaiella sp.]